MGNISDFRAYWRRYYVLNGHNMVEGERECAQFSNESSVSDTNFFTAYSENSPVIYYTWPTSYSPRYASYQPGLIYLPKEFYTYKDLFPQGFRGGKDLEEEIKTDVFSHWDEREVGLNLPYYRGYIDPEFKFYHNDDMGISMLPQLLIQVSTSQNSSFTVKRSFLISANLLIFPSNVNASTLYFGGTDGNYNYRSTSSTWCYKKDDGTYATLPAPNQNTNINSQGFAVFGFCRSEYATYADFVIKLEKFFKILRKIKFYPCLNSLAEATYNNINGFYNRERLTSGQHPNYFGWLIDISNAPYFPTSGFFTERNNRYKDLIYLDWGNGGPDATDSNETDDPNNKDPGHGPGQDPDDKGGDGDHDNTSDNIKPPGIPTLSASGPGLITIYNPTQSELAALGKSLWNPTALQAIKQYFSNPLDTILGLSIVPVQPRTGSSKEIMLGIYKSGVHANLVDSDYVIINCGSIMINRYYGSYLDYSPYTKIKCYLPYIGEVDVNPDEVMQTSLMVLYYVNVVTGDIVAMICSNENILYTAAGNCIRQLPLSSADYSSIINTAVNAVTGIATAIATAGVGSASVAAAGASQAATEQGKALASSRATANNVGSANNLIGDIMNSKFNYQHAGSIGTGSGQLSYQKPYLLIERPNLDLADNYKSFVGYPCNKTLQISRCSGFTQIEASNLAVANATDEEIAEIKELLIGGVII